MEDSGLDMEKTREELMEEFASKTDLMPKAEAAKAVGWSKSNMDWHLFVRKDVPLYPDILTNGKSLVSLSEVQSVAKSAKVGRRLHVSKRKLRITRTNNHFRTEFELYETPRKEGKWETFCVAHKESAFHRTFKIGLKALAKPQIWCPKCGEIWDDENK